ncbi:MAG: hypothetical protein GXY68_01870 [Chloroflexi bacterium]|nr:hypothetical protein [Chloroflexota bacterium]
MEPRQRLVTALVGGMPDRLPVTTHHVMPYFLERYLGGISVAAFFERFGLDPICWIGPLACNPWAGEELLGDDNLNHRVISAPQWRVTTEDLPHPQYHTVCHTISTPRGKLSTVIQFNEHTGWVIERLIKEKSDIELIAEYMPTPRCDVEAVNRVSSKVGNRALVRSNLLAFDFSGQPGTWQDAAMLYGIENVIYATYDDPQWVHAFLSVLHRRKMDFARSLAGAEYDVLELGGGDASSTVISPKMFDGFVAPYDSQIITAAHEAGQRVVYHTCGGMMPLLERIADMGPDAIETLTPPGMGGDVDLAEAKRRVGHRVCLVGGWDQFHFFQGCTPDETRAEVRRCFAAAGQGGGFILSPSDHFFDADPELIEAFADEARRCTYH